jgi:hypothetical protein
VIHVLEALAGIWVAWLIRKALITYYVRKRLCPPEMATAWWIK